MRGAVKKIPYIVGMSLLATAAVAAAVVVLPLIASSMLVLVLADSERSNV